MKKKEWEEQFKRYQKLVLRLAEEGNTLFPPVILKSDKRALKDLKKIKEIVKLIKKIKKGQQVNRGKCI